MATLNTAHPPARGGCFRTSKRYFPLPDVFFLHPTLQPGMNEENKCRCSSESMHVTGSPTISGIGTGGKRT